MSTNPEVKGFERDDKRHCGRRALATVMALTALMASYSGHRSAPFRDHGNAPVAGEPMPPGFLGQLTVFREQSIWRLSTGPMTVSLSPAVVDRLARVINSLQAMPRVMCHENELLYVLAFHPEGHYEPLYRFQGWGCDGEVQVTLDGTVLLPLEDRSCSLLKAVASLAPTSARGTHDVAGLCVRKA